MQLLTPALIALIMSSFIPWVVTTDKGTSLNCSPGTLIYKFQTIHIGHVPAGDNKIDSLFRLKPGISIGTISRLDDILHDETFESIQNNSSHGGRIIYRNIFKFAIYLPIVLGVLYFRE